MTDMPTEVAKVRRMIEDYPVEDYITAALTDTTSTTVTVNDVSLWKRGQSWEVQDGSGTNAEAFFVRSVDSENDQATVKRGHRGSTAVTHLVDAVTFLEPRFSYSRIAEAYSQILDVELYPLGVYEIVEHEITSSDTTNTYAAPTAQCEEFLEVYQRIATTDPKLQITDYTRKLRNADPDLWVTGKVANIYENYGVGGTDIFYVNCAHKLSISTITEAQASGVRARVAALLLLWEDAKRTAGPINQGDQSVEPTSMARLAREFQSQFRQWAEHEADYLKSQYPPKRVFLRSG